LDWFVGVVVDVVCVFWFGFEYYYVLGFEFGFIVGIV